MNAKKGVISGPKRQFKEKIVQIYDTLFKGDPLQPENTQFWDEFFLLKPKLLHIENELQKMNQEQLQIARPNLLLLVNKCIEALTDPNSIRLVYAMQTFSSVVLALCKKTAEFEAETLGFESSEELIRQLLNACQSFLDGDALDVLKSQSLKLLLILATKSDAISQNLLIEHVMNTSLFECLLKLLCHSQTRQLHGYDIVMLLTLLVNYRKYDATNPYVVKLSILDDELALNGYGQVITSSLCDFCNQYNRELLENQNSSWLSSFTNMVGNIFISEEGVLRTQQMRANNAYLLAFYEAIHLNRNFITTLAHTQIDGSSPPSPINTLSGGVSPAEMSAINYIHTQPSNLLVVFFQYCSIVMQDTKSESSANTVKLCFLILCCITEDQYANSLMHDVGLAFKVCLHKLPMRHRKVSPDQTTNSQPLVCSLLDLLVEFFLSHMMKKFPIELYVLCLSVLQRIMCYQKRCRIRLNYVWKNLWAALLLVLRFILQHENYLTKKMNIISLATKIVNIFNFFIIYGDTFLPTPGSYDELYYELIRMHQIFDNIYSLGLRYSTADGEYKNDALRLNNSLINVRAIIKHFSPKIEQWLISANLSTPTEQQILDVVRKNYDSLTLKLQDSLDQYDRYAEKPEYVNFFNNMIRNIVSDTRANIGFTLLNLQKNEIVNNEIK